MIPRLVLCVLLLPVQIILALALALSEFLRTFWPGAARKDTDPEGQPPGRPLCSIIILNWNGRHLLQESLPAVERAVAFSQAEHEVILVDNGSSDDSLAWVQTHHPNVGIVPLEKNIGFVWVPIELAAPGNVLDVDTLSGMVQGHTSGLPFFDPKKEVPSQRLVGSLS